MKKFIYMFILMIQLNVSFSQQFVKFRISLNGVHTKDKIDALLINYSKNTYDSIIDFNQDEYLYFEKNCMYELRFKKSSDYTVNKILLNINNVEVKPLLLNISLLSRTKYSYKQIDEGVFFYNFKINDWQFYSTSEQIFE